MAVELLLVLLLAPTASERFAEYARKAGEAAAVREACAVLEAEVSRRGDAVEALERAGQREEARNLLRETHGAMEELTRCRRRQKGLERDLLGLAGEVRREAEAELDRVLGGGLPREEAYGRMRPLLDILRALPPAGGCALPAYEPLEVSADDPPPVLEEKRILAADVLLRLERQGRADAERLRDLRAERDLRRQLSQFMTGLEVESGARIYDARTASDENRERLRRAEEEIVRCERAVAVGAAAAEHWRERVRALERAARRP
jgi:hypothetical protein